MSEQRFGYSDDIESIVDMKYATDEGGMEVTTLDAIKLLNSFDTEVAALKQEKEQQAQTIVECQKRVAQLACQLEDTLLAVGEQE